MNRPGATRAWLGDNVVARSPLAEHTNPTTIEEKARELALSCSGYKIVAIKELRSWSMGVEAVQIGIGSLGLKEAKDAMDRAYAELGRQQAPWPSSRPGSNQP